MTDIDPDDPRIPSRPLIGLAILSLPVFGVAIVFVLYGIMWAMGIAGRAPQGELVSLGFDGCAEARAVLEARLADVGLDEAEWISDPDGFVVRTQLTGNADVDAALPEVLARPGALEVRAEDRVLATNADLTDASVRMDLFMVGYVLIRLDEAAAQRVQDAIRADPMGRLTFWIDGVDAGWQSNQNPVAKGDLEINIHESDEEVRMREVAAWSVVLDHGPLPCAVSPRAAR